MLTDFHLHTLVSDGELDPVSLLRHAAARGVTSLSITDHDALGAYAWKDGEVFAEARRLGIALTVGIEMDADMDGLEVHVLGFDVRRDKPVLNAHLERVRTARAERARREIALVNELLGAGAIAESDVFVPGRETLMKPHFVRPILARGRFSTYEEANAWFKSNVKAGVPVPKPAVEEAIRLIHGADGWAVLAHPGYYDKAGARVAERLPALKEAGLDGIELDYPYHACSPRLFGQDEERSYVAGLRAAAAELGLRTTRGSDCHTSGDFEKVYGRI
jgi:predicted metal-dependent phosphoesterase TrpH